jgi:prepilin-type N-terminal cleavage/methylation domain-containing protein
MRSQSGFTLIESIITVSIVMVAMAGVLSASVFSYRTFASINNYAQLNRQTRMAMDKMSRDVRQTAALTNGTSASLDFTNFDGSRLQYQYNTNAQTLTYSNAATGEGGTLLKNCVSCTFSMFQFDPVPGSCMLFTNTTTASNCKVVEVNWTCRTTNVLSVNSDMMETARIVLRN